MTLRMTQRRELQVVMRRGVMRLLADGVVDVDVVVDQGHKKKTKTWKPYQKKESGTFSRGAMLVVLFPYDFSRGRNDVMPVGLCVCSMVGLLCN